MARISVAKERDHWKSIRDTYHYEASGEDLSQLDTEIAEYVESIPQIELGADNFPIRHRVALRRMRELRIHTDMANSGNGYDATDVENYYQEACDNYRRFKELHDSGTRIVDQPC